MVSAKATMIFCKMKNSLSLGFLHCNNFHRTGFGRQFTAFSYGVVGGFQSVKTLGVYAFDQHRLPVFFGHLKLNRRHFHTVIAPNAFVPLQRYDNH